MPKTLPKVLKNSKVKAAAAMILLTAVSTAGFLFNHFQKNRNITEASSALGVNSDFSEWVFDSSPDTNSLPQSGHSLFDKIMLTEKDGKKIYDVPFPFENLLKKVQGFLAPSSDEGASPNGYFGVLLPLGRSIQRNAAAPDFFKYPRIAVYVDGLPQSDGNNLGILLKDRLYIGYQERAAAIEVISYNETAGRFEFQVVRDYKEGGTRHLFYANRALCTSCHQNKSPLFSEQPWDETNANPQVAQKLRSTIGADYFHSIPLFELVQNGVPTTNRNRPYLFEQASDRANLFGAVQKLWAQSCQTARCRGGILYSIMQYLLTNRRLDNQSARYAQDYLSEAQKSWTRLWPKGLAIPNALIPNRDALNPVFSTKFSLDSTTLDPVIKNQLKQAMTVLNIPPEFEPLTVRKPSAVWTQDPDGDDMSNFTEVVVELADFFADSDILKLDGRLSEIAATLPPRIKVYDSSCSVGKIQQFINIKCDPGTGDPHANGFSLASSNLKITDGKVSGLLQGLVFKNSQSNCSLPQNISSSSPLCSQTENFTVKGTYVESTDGSATLSLQPEKNSSNLFTPKTGQGERVGAIELRWSPKSPGATSAPAVKGRIKTRDELETLDAVIEALIKNNDQSPNILGGQPFGRLKILKALYGQLQIPFNSPDYFDDDSQMPTGQTEESNGPDISTLKIDDPARLFFRCKSCHAVGIGNPAYYDSNGKFQQDVVNRCIERISFRLHMWDFDPKSRKVKAMPAAFSDHITEAQWKSSDEYKRLLTYVDGMLPAGKTPQTIVSSDYSSLSKDCK